MAARASRSFFATDNEVSLFAQKAPECRVRLQAMGNGVDSEYFAPEESRPSPYHANELPIVFTGAMDYLPNIDAVIWFEGEVFSGILERWPNARFYIVGRNPAAAVLALAGDRIVVTGTVDDVRPYLQYAATVVAPLRIARGIQNKILEAMAMGRPVIASTDCAAAVDAVAGQELLTATSPEDYISAISQMLEGPETAATIGEAARQRVIERYSWEAHMKAIDPYLPAPSFRMP
jgi:polysaccharide biosynthesis protein PslH